MKKNKEICIDFQENGKDYLMHECSNAFLILYTDTSGLCSQIEPVCICLDKKTAEKYIKLHKGFRSIRELPLVVVSAKNEEKQPKGNKDLDLNKLYEMQKENREIMENLKHATETPMFSQSSEDIAKTLSDAGIKTAKANHEFNIGNALKYLWRAGRKSEEGISDSQKQIEDLEKAVFYIKDEIEFLKSKQQ